MGNIAKSLSVYMATAGKYPAPENSVQIQANGTTIGTQGFAGKNTLSAIKFNGVGQDPIDSQYYTYTTDAGLSKFTLMAYYENQSNITASAGNTLLNQAFADAGTYSNRFPGVNGDPIGVLVSSGSLAALQMGGANVDIATTTTPYIAYIRNKMSLAGTGAALEGIQWMRGQASKSFSTAQQSEWVDIISTIGQNRSTTPSAPSSGTSIPISGAPAIVASTFSSNGDVYAVSGTGGLYTITPSTNTVTGPIVV